MCLRLPNIRKKELITRALEKMNNPEAELRGYRVIRTNIIDFYATFYMCFYLHLVLGYIFE